MRIKAILSLCLFTLATAVSADEFIKINTDQVGLVPAPQTTAGFTNPIWANAWLTKAICSIAQRQRGLSDPRHGGLF